VVKRVIRLFVFTTGKSTRAQPSLSNLFPNLKNGAVAEIVTVANDFMSQYGWKIRVEMTN